MQIETGILAVLKGFSQSVQVLFDGIEAVEAVLVHSSENSEPLN